MTTHHPVRSQATRAVDIYLLWLSQASNHAFSAEATQLRYGYEGHFFLESVDFSTYPCLVTAERPKGA